MASIWDKRISISIFGEPDAPAMGVTIGNLPVGEYINAEELANYMARRVPNLGDAAEADIVPSPRIMSGISNERTTGAPLCAFIQNVRRSPKPQGDNVDRLSRPGNADYTGTVRYRSFSDFESRGNFSMRLTAPLCFAGAVCAQILERRGIYTGAHIASIHNVKDNPFDAVRLSRDAVISVRQKEFPVINDRKGWTMLRNIRKAAEYGESLGGVIECGTVNVPAGIGSPIFDGLENNIAQLMFGIPGVKGIEFGTGFTSANMLGSQQSDEFYVSERGHILTKTNNHGGIIGGISSGMPITLNVAIKPAPKSVSADERETCTVPAAVVCVESAVNIALLSHMIDYPNFC